jgi:CubicO group peptidase (beta-lactamase class C family)
MKLLLRLAAGSLAALLATSVLHAAGGAAEGTASTLDPLVARLLKDGDVPGLSLALVRDGKVSLVRSWGVRDASGSAPVTEDTIFEAASLSKPVFAYAVLKLADAGQIDLDAPVAKYLPGEYVEDPRLRAVTVRRVLTHTTGFPNWRPSGQPLKIQLDPGERFSYSGEGFVYLQKAVENATGQTLEALARRLVFEPLGMKDTSYSWQERFEGRKARGHDEMGTPRTLRRPAEANAAASLHTTARDYGRFLAAILSRTGLRKETLAEMERSQIQVDEACQNCVTGKPSGRLSKELGWGLGWGIERTEDGTAIWHWGDNGGSGFHCFVEGYPDRRLGVVIFTNGTGGHGIIPEVLTAAIGGRHPSTAWLDYERWDSPARTWFKDIAARGEPAVAEYRERKRSDPAAALKEQQVNRVGYQLLSRKKLPEAIAVFEMNVADFPSSWNVHDSLGEAYAAAGQREKAIASYEKSLELNPSNTSGADQLRKLKAGS